jgi:hypothetical protein
MAIVVELGTESVAFPVVELRPIGVANEVVNGAPIAVVMDPLTDQWAVFPRQLDDRIVELDLVEGSLIERDGDGRFDAKRSLATQGNQNLNALPGFTFFPRDYVNFFGAGMFWTAEGLIPVS